MGFARINGLTMHYRAHGPENAPAVVLVNSLGTDARIWDAVIERLSPRHRVISYDKRGHGLSDAPAADYSLDDHVVDLDGMLAWLGIDRLALCGVSVGGQIAQGFALRHPGRLAGLILCDTAAQIGNAEMWNGRIEAVRSQGLAAISAAVLARWFTADFSTSNPDEFAGWRNMFERMPVQGYAGTCAGIRDTDLRAEIGSITLPTLVVVGAEDLSTPPALVRETANLLPNARFEIIADAGHIPSIEQPAKLASLMQNYLHEVGHD